MLATGASRDPGWLMALYIIGAIFVPPLTVAIKTGDPVETVINILWWILGIIPCVARGCGGVGQRGACGVMNNVFLLTPHSA
jgi:uncharacterized membrane protein YqaE (UPF0057 family)